MTIVLPIPDRRISPNAQTGHSRPAILAKAKRIKRHKTNAMLRTKEAIGRIYHAQGLPVPAFAGYSLAHFFPTAAYRDDDNADGACKAYRDGIAKALGIDDRRLPKLALSTFHKDPANPRVEITLHTAQPIGPEWDNELS
jgi:crossover junction endodeoxyribonuclease RusA